MRKEGREGGREGGREERTFIKLGVKQLGAGIQTNRLRQGADLEREGGREGGVSTGKDQEKSRGQSS